MKKVLFIGIPILIVIAVGVYFFKFRASNQGGDGASSTVEVQRGDIVEKALATGKIEPEHEISVKSQVSGMVEKVYVEVGDRVHKGDRLLDIRPEPTPLEFAEANRAFEAAKIHLELAGKELQRAKELREKGLLSQQTYEGTEQQYEEARLNEQTARERLSLLQKGRMSIANREVETTIRSPIDGHALERLVNVGDPVVPLTSYQEGTKLMALADMDRLLFRGTVDEIDVGKLREGMDATLKVGALPDEVVEGRLTRISPKSREVNNAIVFDVEIAVLKKDGQALRAGYSANADIVLNKRENVLRIPERVIEFRGDSTFVKLPGESDAPPKERFIKTGLSDGIHIEVTSGLNEGDRVLEKSVKEIK